MDIKINKEKSIGIVKESVDLEEKAFAEVLKSKDPDNIEEIIKSNEIKEKQS